MSALGLDVLFVMSFTLGISWLVWAFDVRMGRSRQVMQLPLPLDNLGFAYGQTPQRRQQPTMAVVGFMLVFFCAMGAAVLGKLATMQPAEAAAVFAAYPLLHDLWGLIMGLGPIVCVAMAVPGTCYISCSLETGKR